MSRIASNSVKLQASYVYSFMLNMLDFTSSVTYVATGGHNLLTYMTIPDYISAMICHLPEVYLSPDGIRVV